MWRLEEVVGDEVLQCLVVGKWAEGCQYFHTLVQRLAEIPSSRLM